MASLTVIGILIALSVAGLMGWLAALGAHMDLSSGPLALSLGLLCLGPTGFYALTLERGKAAPALRSGLAPWVLFALAYFCVQLSGGLASPLWGVYPLLALLAARNAGILPALGLAGLTVLLESFPLWMQAHGSDSGASAAVSAGAWPRALALALPGLGWGLGSLSRGSHPVSPAPPQAAPAPPAPAAGDGSTAGPPVRDGGSAFTTGDPRLPLDANASSADAGNRLDQALNGSLDLAFHAHPSWNALSLWWGDPRAVTLRHLRLRQGKPLAGARVEAGQGYLGLVLRERKPLGLDALTPGACAALPYAEQPYQAGALRIVPLEDEGRLVGLLVCDKAGSGAFSADECSALGSLARLLVAHAQNAAHHERLGRSDLRTKRLYDAAKQLSLDLERADMLARFGELLPSLVPCDSWALGMREDEEAPLERVASRGYSPDAPASLSLDRSTALRSTLSHAEGAVLFNGAPGAAVPAVFLEGLAGSPVHFLLAPLRLRGRLTGVLKLDRRDEPFSGEERDAAYIFASQASSTLEHARLYALHQRLATTDGLTGLYNHRYFQERLAHELGQALRTGRPLSLALTDIDFFKKFNDTFGHQEGDVVLRKVAALLQSGVRQGQDVACRYGGEEFVVIMPDCDVVEARQRMDALREECAATLSGGEGESLQRVTLSIGLSAYPQAAREQRELIHLADAALYKAKHTGRNRVCSFKDL